MIVVLLIGVIIVFSGIIPPIIISFYRKRPFKDGRHKNEKMLEIEYKESNRMRSEYITLFIALLVLSVPMIIGNSTTKSFGILLIIFSMIPLIYIIIYGAKSSRRYYWIREWERRRLHPSEK